MIIIILHEINMPLAKLVRIVQHIVMIRNKILCICLFIFFRFGFTIPYGLG